MNQCDNRYDVIFVGAGPANIFAAYRLTENKDNQLKILIVEKGKSIKSRHCPKRETGKCMNCNPCHITSGFSGAGAFSDGKLTLASSVTGGCLDELITEEETRKYIDQADAIYCSLGADEHIYGVDNPEAITAIRKKAIQANMKLVDSPVRHLGTESAYDIYGSLEEKLLEAGVEILYDHMVTDLVTTEKDRSKYIDGVKVLDMKGYEETLYSDIVVIGTGREGSVWFKSICEKHDIETEIGTVDIGVRVECRDEVMKELNDTMYESKLIYYSKTYADKVRTFCQNPSGEVALENYVLSDGSRIKTVNGHAYKADELKTENTNFAILVSKNFTEPFKEPLEYGASFARIANMLAGGTVLVQSYGDLKRGRRSTPKRIMYGNVVPTLKNAVPGDLTSVIPSRIMTDITEMIEAMDKIVPGIANDETLLYGIEVKFYSNKVKLRTNCETSLEGLFAIGDSSGWTRGLSMASAMGLWLADKLMEYEF